MKFVISEKLFDMLPTVCFGVVVARDMNNHGPCPEISRLLDESIKAAREKFQGAKLKEHPDLVCYREAFRKLGINPNKFPSSVEALTGRVIKGGGLPDINPAVNLANAVSLKYTLPMGAHDLDTVQGDMHVRFSKAGDIFTPFGQNEPEVLEEGELVYIDGREVRTRRWIWRQSDKGKVTEASKNIFFPIDGFSDYNREAVLAAREELAQHLERIFSCRVDKFYLDAQNNTVEI